MTSQIQEAKLAERQRCLAIVEQEEELPGPMPDEVFKAIAESVVKADKLTLAEQLRSIVRSTKQSISSRIKEE